MGCPVKAIAQGAIPRFSQQLRRRDAIKTYDAASDESVGPVLEILRTSSDRNPPRPLGRAGGGRGRSIDVFR